MNQQALALVGRAKLEKPGRSPFSAFATGFCIDSDGVVATCWHAIDHLMTTYSLVDVPKPGDPVAEFGRLESHECPMFSFFGIGDPGEALMFPMLSGTGHFHDDIAVIELGGQPRPEAFPVVSLAEQAPVVGEFLHVLGQFQPPATPLDPDGDKIGFAPTRQGGTVVSAAAKGFCIDYAVPKGMSGAPVFLPDTDEVVGMVVEVRPPALASSRIGISKSVTWAG